MRQFVRGDRLGRPFGGLDVLHGAGAEVLFERGESGRIRVAKTHHVGSAGVVLLCRRELCSAQTGESEAAKLEQEQQVVATDEPPVYFPTEVEQTRERAECA